MPRHTHSSYANKTLFLQSGSHPGRLVTTNFNTLRCCWKRRDMSEHKILLLFFFVGIIAIALVSAADDPQITYLGSGCSESLNRTYKNLTAFNHNQAAVFGSLASNLSSNGSHFATSVIDNDTTDPVYGLVQCREYLTPNECLQCFTAAKAKVKKFCPKSNGAKIHLDGCFLRFENNTFFDEGEDGGDAENCSTVSETVDFSNTAYGLLSRLIQNASTNDGYAVGSLNSIYALVQCVESLNNDTCQSCLRDARERLTTNCLLIQEAHALMAGCFIRYANYPFFSHNLTASTENENGSKSKRVRILLGSIGGGILLAAMCVAVLCRYCQCRQRFKSFIPVFAKREEDLDAREVIEQVTIYNYETLRDATANFNPSNLLGKGGFGEVYKGKLLDGKVIAVKKLSERQKTQAMNEFLTEVKLISSVRHRNLVRLLGCCSHGHERLLVYEFMSNNSLDKHLFGMFLDWETRLNITVGTARGLAYLHEESNVRIVHRDIKPGNILLDDKFLPKIADFGLARFYPEGESHVSTKVGGTIGYTAPEYVVRGQLTEKADVYSFGVVVLEIVSGRKCIDQKLPDPLQLLLQWIWQLYESEQILEMVDPKLKGEYPQEQMVRVIRIALLCVKASPSQRPSMTQIVSMLTSNSEITDQPTKPAFLESNVNDRTPTSSSRDSAGSHGSVTVSLFPR
ncbi:cysteine-rich receptor-like protein kinase 42 isoform X2 [Cryptomeria japonica]|uniref:cysteine-rich receptor-like protein kinase 42 isoform X2 n=1 Tax=Cryptomeria japonica TaxID=3369 RepID=UPI0027DA9026|nr:cysteine-rich receptor-like protein kinase 42 isoform X2 [Cryptomeria japonica]